ncbi:Metal-dependent hydrolase, endonuclease/exonuclease/phosphatase family [Micromonospora rhizosphaerae]|uniref:Metal-dependent hydrolase, endonuclease/exonuclease/phosphatase family n=1 Tax=Micromonospora rhizosphaerae TaxID=568872 RepID=A0A1C6SSH1_9ACTN|nr:endonuclease/exonuclease/phosphatase family protein [Micromonospora rhizosphaerae]SCL32203.1 Metal-dependent hydrolase, endonuclease/exonuclease/phosphatase family [Micromonospora rhizosphaerae]
MRLATFNLLHGRSLTDGLVDPDRLAAAVTALDVDILALQEVDRDQSRSGNLDLTAIAARALDAPEHHFAAAVVGTPGEQFRPLTHDDDGHGEPCYGVGLVSRYPVRSWQVTRLRPAPVRSPVHVPETSGGVIHLLRDEPRVVLAAVLDTPHGPLTVAATHLSFVPGWNVHQLRRVVRALRALPAPRILLGDLNLPAGAAALLSRWRPLGRRPTYPAGEPHVQLDHILADRQGLDRLPPVTAVDTPLSTISDHRPLIVDLG